MNTWENDAWNCKAVGGLDKFILVAVARRADDRGYAWPSVADLTRLTGVGATKVKEAIKTALDRGLMTRPEASELTHLGPTRSVVYLFTDPASWLEADISGDQYSSAQVQDYPQSDHYSSPQGYTWDSNPTPALTAPISSPGRVATSATPDATTTSRTGGIIITTSNGHESDHEPRETSRLIGTVSKRAAPKPSRSDLVYFEAGLKEATRKTGVEVLGAVKREALGRQLKMLRSRDGLTQPQIRSMIDAYMAQPSAWNKNVHPWQDFCSSGTLNRLRNQTSHRDSKPSGTVRPVPVLTEAMPVLTVEDVRRRDLERGPSWLRK